MNSQLRSTGILGLFASTVAECDTLLLESCLVSTNLLSLALFDVNPFPLAFNSITNMNGFFIEVAELISLLSAVSWLPGSALLSFAGMSRKRVLSGHQLPFSSSICLF